MNAQSPGSRKPVKAKAAPAKAAAARTAVAAAAVEIHPATPDRLADLGGLFGTNKTTSGCYCMWFLVPAKESHAGWGTTNQQSFESLARSVAGPVGLLAYRAGEAVGWCATGPRARYDRALRSRVLKARDVDEDPRVWLVPCFFVRRDVRRQGVTHALLDAAVELARAHGATAVEGFPLAGDARRTAADAYLGVEPRFAASGFHIVARPTPARVLMRRQLSR